MAKPTELPRWGTDQSNEVEPSSGQKDTGHTPSSPLVSGYENWLKRVTYEWLLWLDQDELEFFDLHVSNNLTVDNDTTIGGTLDVTGATTFIDSVNIGTTLQVLGDTTLGFASATTMSVSTLSWSTPIKRQIHAMEGRANNGSYGAASASPGFIDLDSSTDVLSWSVPFSPGEQLHSWKVLINDSGGGHVFTLRKYTRATATEATIATDTSAGTGIEDIGTSDLFETHGGEGVCYFVQCVPDGGTGCRIYSLVFEVKRP